MRIIWVYVEHIYPLVVDIMDTMYNSEIDNDSRFEMINEIILKYQHHRSACIQNKCPSLNDEQSEYRTVSFKDTDYYKT